MASLRASCQTWLSELMILTLVGHYFDENELVSLSELTLNACSTAEHYPRWLEVEKKRSKN
jgi:hypothetical protein